MNNVKSIFTHWYSPLAPTPGRLCSHWIKVAWVESNWGSWPGFTWRMASSMMGAGNYFI